MGSRYIVRNWIRLGREAALAWQVMSRDTQPGWKPFEQLPAEEKRSFADEILRRLLPWDSGPLADEEIGAASDVLFAALDEDDADARRGEVWLIDFGLAAKTRPALVVSAWQALRRRSYAADIPCPPNSPEDWRGAR